MDERQTMDSKQPIFEEVKSRLKIKPKMWRCITPSNEEGWVFRMWKESWNTKSNGFAIVAADNG